MGIFLAQTWRLRPELNAYVSETFYEGRLEPAPVTSTRSVAEGNGVRFLPVAHTGHRTAAPEEAQVVRDEIERLVGTGYEDERGRRELRHEDVIVVAPYNSHVRCLREALPRALVAACLKNGVARLVHLSALKAARDAPSQYLRSQADGEAAIHEAGGRAEIDVRDLGSVAAGAELVEEAVEAFGRVDVVVNNAGTSVPADVADLDDPSLDLHLGVHLRATVGTTSAALRLVGPSGWGRIVNTVSGHGLEPRHPGSSAYGAAKAAVFGFTRAAAIEAAPLGVTVNAVAPLAYTRMSEEYLSRLPDAAERFDPAHVARVVVFLCSDAASGWNGRVLRVEGEQVGEYRVVAGEMVELDRIEELGAGEGP